MKILGIETSCDETSAAIVEDGVKILSSVVASQADIFAKYGGVIPEVASRKHLELIVPTVSEALEKANLKIEEIDAIAYTKEPGLLPALLVGISYAKALALSINVPAIPINHLEGHVYANNLQTDEQVDELSYPNICLLVSGGHTNILYVKSATEYEVLGETKDDAAGEAFDKVAKILGLPYPGGPVIDQLAKDGDEGAFDFPRPMIKENNYDFSFSGLKTAVLRLTEKETLPQDDSPLSKELRNNRNADIAASFQEAVADVLVEKTIKAAIAKKVDTITLAGGVAANSRLRERMIRAGDELGLDVRYPPLAMCMDNASMIAGLAYWKLN